MGIHLSKSNRVVNISLERGSSDVGLDAKLKGMVPSVTDDKEISEERRKSARKKE